MAKSGGCGEWPPGWTWSALPAHAADAENRQKAECPPLSSASWPTRLHAAAMGCSMEERWTKDQSVSRDDHRMRLILMAALTLAFCGFACRKTAKESERRDQPSASSQDANRKFPDNVELSKIKGVSIVQCPARDYPGHTVYGDGSASEGRAETAPLSEVIYAWCDFNGWLLIEAELPDARYNISIEAEQGQPIWPLAKKALEDVFGLHFVEGKEMLDVFVLRKTQDPPRGLARVEATSANWGTKQTAGGFGYEIRAGTMQDLTGIISRYVDEPVVDETGLTGFYRFTLAMDHWQPRTVFSALEALGLKLEKAGRELPVMRVVAARQEAPASLPHLPTPAR